VCVCYSFSRNNVDPKYIYIYIKFSLYVCICIYNIQSKIDGIQQALISTDVKRQVTKSSTNLARRTFFSDAGFIAPLQADSSGQEA